MWTTCLSSFQHSRTVHCPLCTCCGIIKDIRTKADVDAINQIVKDAADGKIRIKPYSREEISAGTRFGGPSLGACLVVARGLSGVNEAGMAWNNGKSEGQGKQIEALLRLAGTFVDDIYSFIESRATDNVVELDAGGSSVKVFSDFNTVWKIRPLACVDEDFGGAVHDFNDILLSNAVLGERFASRMVGGCKYDGQLAMILEQPYVEIPRTREMKQMIFDFMAENGFEQEEYNDDCFSNGRINLRDVVIRNVGVKDGKLFIFDPQASYTKECLESQGVLFSTPELDPKRSEEKEKIQALFEQHQMNSGDVPYFNLDSARIIAQNFLNPQVGNLENTEIDCDCVGAVASLHDQMGNGITRVCHLAFVKMRSRSMAAGMTLPLSS